MSASIPSQAAASVAPAATAAAATATRVNGAHHTRQRSRSLTGAAADLATTRTLAAAMAAMNLVDAGGGAAAGSPAHATAAGGEGVKKKLHTRKRSQSMVNETTPADAERIKRLESEKQVRELALFSAHLEVRQLKKEKAALEAKFEARIAALVAQVASLNKAVAALSKD